MALLDGANTGAYGNPEITTVDIGVRNNPGILIPAMTEGPGNAAGSDPSTGVDVYTHSEMLPAHYYPFFKKYTNLPATMATPGGNKKKNSKPSNGPILMTSNCIVPPKDSYKDRLWTTGAAGYPGCKHIVADENGHKDFSALIAQAKECKPPVEIEHGTIVGGFAHEQVFALADKVVEAVNPAL